MIFMHIEIWVKSELLVGWLVPSNYICKYTNSVDSTPLW